VDLPTRLFHVLLAAGVAVAWLSGESERWRVLHVTAGLTVAGLVAWRLVWGLVGPRGARLGAWWRRAAGLLTLRPRGGFSGLVSAVPAVHAATVLALLAVLVPLTASGWLRHEDLVGEWAEELHEALGDGVLLLIAAHLGLVVWQVLRRGPDLLMRMVHGRTPGRGPDLVSARAWMAVPMLVAVLAFWGWSVQDAAARRADGAVTATGPDGAGRHTPSTERAKAHRGTGRSQDEDDDD
jgi:cytochrome b